jgi:imidazolonepropionase-like amidohydrolase
LVRTAAREAHRLGKPVFAHPQHRNGLENAIEGGVDVLVHTAIETGPWERRLVLRIVEAKMALIPTLQMFAWEAARGGDSVEQWIEMTTAQLQAFSQAGGEVLFGTDVGYLTVYDPTEEYVLMGRAGLDYRRILASLTTAPARRFGDKRRGRVAAGFDGDLVVLEADPAADVRNFAKVRWTIRRGVVLQETPPQESVPQ